MSAIALVQTVQPNLAAGVGLVKQNSAAIRSSDASGASGVLSSRADRAATSSGVGADHPVDTVTFSSEALEGVARLEADQAVDGGQRIGEETEGQAPANPADDALNADARVSDEDAENVAAPRGADGEPLSDAEVDQVRELKARDREVRQHELAHVAAGGPYVTSGPTYQYQQGPDGKRYAVGGNVGIDVSAEDTPEKTIAKARIVRRAALAPAEPSAQDRRVAAQASQLEQQARAELNEQRREETQSQQQDEPTDLGSTFREFRPGEAFDAVA